MDWNLTFLILRVLAAVGGTIGCFFAFRKLGGFLWQKGKESNKVFESLKSAIETIDDIHREFKPNGGHSIKDILNRIEEKSDVNDQAIKILLGHMRIASFEASPNGLWTFASKHWKTISGLTYQESLGHGWLNGICEAEQERVSVLWENCIEDERAFFTEAKLVTKEEVKFYAWPTKSAKGKVLRFIGIVERAGSQHT